MTRYLVLDFLHQSQLHNDYSCNMKTSVLHIAVAPRLSFQVRIEMRDAWTILWCIIVIISWLNVLIYFFLTRSYYGLFFMILFRRKMLKGIEERELWIISIAHIIDYEHGQPRIGEMHKLLLFSSLFCAPPYSWQEISSPNAQLLWQWHMNGSAGISLR